MILKIKVKVKIPNSIKKRTSKNHNHPQVTHQVLYPHQVYLPL